jgi:hypothetical protein
MSEDIAIFVDDFRQFLTELQNLCAKMKEQIDKLQPSKWTWNPEAIKWEKATGASGEYERSEDVNNLEFKALLKDLAEHNGRLTRDGWFYWTFKNGSVVGRKKKSKEV